MRQNYSWQSDSLEPLVLLWHCQEPGKRLLSRARRKCSLSWHDTISMQPKQHEKHVGHLDGMLATSSLAGNRLRVATLVCRQAKMPLQTSIDASILQQMWVLSSANVCFVNSCLKLRWLDVLPCTISMLNNTYVSFGAATQHCTLLTLELF